MYALQPGSLRASLFWIAPPILHSPHVMLTGSSPAVTLCFEKQVELILNIYHRPNSCVPAWVKLGYYLSSLVPFGGGHPRAISEGSVCQIDIQKNVAQKGFCRINNKR